MAIETIQNKTQSLKRLVDADTVDLTLLQLQLQGAVMATVNEGPLFMAKVFLGNDQVAQAGREELRLVRSPYWPAACGCPLVPFHGS